MFLILLLFFSIVDVPTNYASIDRREIPRIAECQCNPNEHFVNSSQICEISCTNRYYLSESSICDPFTGCVCNQGYVRLKDDGTGPCVDPDECPPEPIWCGPNEVKTLCKIECPPQTCERLYKTFECKNKTICRRGCNCKDGYLRNGFGICIPISFCPRPFNDCYPSYDSDSFTHQHARPSNELFVAPAPSRACETSKSSSQSSATAISNTKTSSTFSSSDSCSRQTSNTFPNSHPKICPGINEVWHLCPDVCLLESCDDVDCPPVPCTKEQVCVPRCVCIDNHYRNDSNVCIHKAYCPYYIYIILD